MFWFDADANVHFYTPSAKTTGIVNSIKMQRLNLPEYNFRIITENGKLFIFDSIRKKFVVLTPEEWVRQNFIEYLKNEKNYPANLMSVEKQILVNGKQRRFDLLIYNRNGEPIVIIEFKSPDIKINQNTFDQVVRYNMALRVKKVIVSNGLQHFACEIDYKSNNYTYLKEIPAFG